MNSLNTQYNVNQLKRFYSNGLRTKFENNCCNDQPATRSPAPECCRHNRPPIPPNPCCVGAPREPNSRRFKYLFFFVGIPLIMFQTYMIHGTVNPPKGECRDYEYMLMRSKRFPWGDGVKSLFHSDKYNHLPGECTEPED